MRIAMLSCAFASAILSHTAFPSQDAVAGSSEAVESPTVQAQPRVRLAQNTAQTTGAAGKPGPVAGGGQRLPAGTEAAAHGEISVLAAAAKAEKGKEARPQASLPPIIVVRLVRLDRASWTGHQRGCGLRRYRSALREICRVVC
jgi:hypothetical protein